MRGRRASGRLVSRRNPPAAASSPSTPPPADSSRLSAMIGRATSHWSAPSATRTATSRRRLDSRASSRLAMLAQTISSRKPTAPISTSSAGRDAATSCSCAGTTRALQPALLSLNSVAIRAARTEISFCACLHRRAIGQAADDGERSRAARAAVQILGIEGQRRPRVHRGRGRELKSWRHDADHGKRHGVELDGGADDVRVRRRAHAPRSRG